VLGGLVQINPIWVYGPYSAHVVSQAAQPDWYMGWLEGAIRLFPNWEIRALGHEVPNPFFPTVLMPGLFFTVLGLWPWIERRVTKDVAEHNLLNFPRDVPWRTALGTAALTYFVVLTVAGGDDVIAANLGVSIETMTRVLRAAVLVVPAVSYAVALYLARELKRTGIHPVKRSKISTVRRTREGGFGSTETEGGGFAGPGEEA
jgi:ubiquinol-cytochrome c reductase cytochrome b subunit